MSYGDHAEIPGHLLVASNGAVDYYAAEKNCGRVINTALKFQQSGIASRMLRPARAFHMRRLTEAVESPAVWKLEDELKPDEQIIGFAQFTDIELANEIVARLEG